MPFTLIFCDSPVPSIPPTPGLDGAVPPAMSRVQPEGRQEHFGTEDAALKRAAALLPGPAWLDLRLFGPDGRQLAGQAQLAARLGVAAVQSGIG